MGCGLSVLNADVRLTRLSGFSIDDFNCVALSLEAVLAKCPHPAERLGQYHETYWLSIANDTEFAVGPILLVCRILTPAAKASWFAVRDRREFTTRIEASV